MKNLKKFVFVRSLVLLSFYVNLQVGSIAGRDVPNPDIEIANSNSFFTANTQLKFNGNKTTWETEENSLMDYPSLATATSSKLIAEKFSFLCCPCHYIQDDLKFENDTMYLDCSVDRPNVPFTIDPANSTMSSCCTLESNVTSTSACTGKVFKIHHFKSTEISNTHAELANNNRSNCLEPNYSDCHCGLCVVGRNSLKKEINYVLVGLLIASITLMIITILVYTFLPMFKNIHGKCILNHLICLMLFFVCQLIEIYVKPADIIITSIDRKMSLCWVLGLVSYLLSMWANFWLAAVNLDIYHTFRSQTIEKAHSSRKRYKKLKIGAWSIPIVIAIVVIFLDFYVDDDSIFSPHIGCERCFFSVLEGYSEAIFYYSVIGGLLCFNLFTFIVANYILCTYQCRTNLKNKKDSTLSIIMNRMFLFFKLFCVTGTTWTINFGLWFYQYHNLDPEDRPIFARFLEAFNVSHGFCYFIVFICKPNVLKELWTLRTKPEPRKVVYSESNNRFVTNPATLEISQTLS